MSAKVLHLPPMKLHESLTQRRVLWAAAESSFGIAFVGFCVACGASDNACETDARNYKCKACGKHGVFAAEELEPYMVIPFPREDR